MTAPDRPRPAGGPPRTGRAPSPGAGLRPRRGWVGGLRRQAYFVAVLVAIAVGFVFVTAGYWRRGLVVLAVAALGAGVLRLVLAPRQAGWLAVRRRWLDVLLYLGFGLAILLVTITIPS